jgi:hypothetical protein
MSRSAGGRSSSPGAIAAPSGAAALAFAFAFAFAFALATGAGPEGDAAGGADPAHPTASETTARETARRVREEVTGSRKGRAPEGARRHALPP